MYCARALVLILHLANGRLTPRPVCVQFQSKDKEAAETRSYSACSTIFHVSRRLCLEMGRCPGGSGARVCMDAVCRPRAFDIAVALCDGRRLGKVSAEDIADVLCLAEHLDIQSDCKAAFYMGLAAATDIASIREKSAVCFSTHGAKIYALQLLRRHMRMSGLETIVMGERATLSTRSSYNLLHTHGSATDVGVVSEVKVLQHAMSSIRLEDREVLFWLVGAMEAQALDVSGCYLDAGTMAHVSGIKSLTRLVISNCKIEPGCLRHLQEPRTLRELVFMWNRLDTGCAAEIGRVRGLEVLDISCCRIEPGSIAHLQGLESLRALYALGTNLSSASMLEVGCIQSLERLSIGRCELCPEGLRHLQRLGSLRELVLSYNQLGIRDAEELSKMTRLSMLDISNCKIEPECLVHLAALRLKELRVSRSRLHKSNIQGIGRITSLESLDMRECEIKPGCFSLLRKLRGLKDLCVSCNELDRDDLAAICRMQSLERLDISFCKIRPGGLRHIGKLRSLRELNVSYNSMTRDEFDCIRELHLEKLVSRGCTVEPERPTKLQKSRLLCMGRC